jgi:hypothetical protein
MARNRGADSNSDSFASHQAEPSFTRITTQHPNLIVFASHTIVYYLFSTWQDCVCCYYAEIHGDMVWCLYYRRARILDGEAVGQLARQE